MKKLITLSVMCLVAIAAVAKEYAQEQPDSIKTQELKEVVVNASYLTREDDHISAIPTKEQRKHDCQRL